MNLPLVPFDLAAANALLEAAGWKRAADGIRIKDGRRLSLVFVCGSGLADYDIENELIRAWWKQIGVELTVKRFPASLLYATRGDGGILAAGKFDIARFALVPDTSEDFSDVFACGNNAAQWCDPSTNAAMERAKTENDDRARARDLASVQRAVYDHVPIIVLDARRELAIYNSDLKNWRPHPSIPFDDMMNVDI